MATGTHNRSETRAGDPSESDLKTVMDFAKAGAPRLALRLMDVYQPGRLEHPEGWLRWERERITILQLRGLWAELTERLAAPPPGLPDAFYIWAREMRAMAFLRLGQGRSARRAIMGNVWAGDEPRQEVIARWQRLIIQAYLAEERDQDAERAMLRYRLDHGDGGQDWAVLRAIILLRVGEPEQALAVLQGVDAPAVSVLRDLAALRMGKADAEKLYTRVRKKLRSSRKTTEGRAELWALAAEAAARSGLPGDRVGALEGALGQVDGVDAGHPLAVAVDELWTAYIDYGQKVANDAQLLIGDEQAWTRLVDVSSKDPVKARALLATLALKSTVEAQRTRAHLRFAEALLGTDFGSLLLKRLYLESARFDSIERVPGSVRHLLAQGALDSGDIDAASRLVAGLREAPEGQNPFEWALRRSRILILGGDAVSGADGLEGVIDSVLASPEPRDEADIDRLLQVVFDLQAVEAHQLAFDLLRKLHRAELGQRHRREILFWMADSAKALGNREAAAALYLRSAMWPDAYAMDQWAQTARYHAADLMADLGWLDDARSLYQGLLAVTKDPGRRAVLRQRLQRLLLQRSP
ncbi:MAG: hypothetical protein ACPGUC_07115 [Gammaproteobacteria bacterium]